MSSDGSTAGTVVKTGRLMVNQANSGIRRGPGHKNLGPTAKKQANPTGTIRALSSNLMGPDKGAGGS